MRHLTLTLTLALALVLSACASEVALSSANDDGEQGRLTATAGALAGDWELVEGTVDGEAIPLVDGAAVTLTATPSTLSGTSACNSYSADLTIDVDTMTVEHMAVTRMACDDARMTVEGLYLAGLERVTAATGEVDGLVLTGPGVELRFKPAI